MLQKRRPWRDKRFAKMVSDLPCCIKGFPGPNDPHHTNKMGHSTMGGKCGDERQVPLSHILHQELHQAGERTFWAKYGIDPEAVISATQAEWERRHGGRPWEGV